jgi:CRP/FNR family cyclic AMP-dependent transcriptional regulator
MLIIRRDSDQAASKWKLAKVARKAPLFRSMTRTALSWLLDHSTETIYDSNDVIVRQGEHDDGVYLVLIGRVRVSQSSGNGADVFIAELGPGEIFGELAILESQPRSATVQTLERTSCLKVSGKDFLTALSRSTSS